jgi:uncharacterized protein (TIGR03437 family)
MRALWIVLLTCSGALAQGSLSVYNAASRVTNGPIAPGSLIELDYFAAISGSGNLPQIAGVRIQPQGSNQTFDAQLVNPSSFSTLAVVPNAVPTGPVTVSLLFQSGSTISEPVTVAPVAAGVFSASGAGRGPAAAQNDAQGSQPSLNQLTNPALPGQYVTLWATGMGTLTTPDVSVNISGISVPASFAGTAPGLAGMDQINFQLPGDFPAGCYTPVFVTAGSSVSNTVTIATSKGGPCAHPLGLSAGQMKALDNGSGIRLGTISFYANVIAPQPGVPDAYTRSESIQASFDVQDAYFVFLISQTLDGGPGCSLGNPLETYALFVAGGRTPPAGPTLTATDSSGNALSLTADPFGYYSTQLTAPPTAATSAQLSPPVLSPGPWQINVPGGPVIGAFQQSYTLPPQIRWMNRESLATISRSADVPVIWNPQGYSTDDVVTAILPSGIGAVTCTAPAASGQLTVPASLLQQIPPSEASHSGYIMVIVEPKNPTIFGIPVIGSLDAPLLFKYSSAIRVPWWFSSAEAQTVAFGGLRHGLRGLPCLTHHGG